MWFFGRLTVILASRNPFVRVVCLILGPSTRDGDGGEEDNRKLHRIKIEERSSSFKGRSVNDAGVRLSHLLKRVVFISILLPLLDRLSACELTNMFCTHSYGIRVTTIIADVPRTLASISTSAWFATPSPRAEGAATPSRKMSRSI